ncbi:MAG: hypothetical protein PHW04_02275 [Candidatus Wallbacteria bacterium]|nr:hypothetical protein [Candidatus Wallbacteria bacterium]
MKKHFFLLAGLAAGILLALKCRNHSCQTFSFLDQYKKFVTHVSQVIFKDYKKMSRKQMKEFLSCQVDLLLDAIYPDDEESKEATDSIL